jgi:hypothetical protein
MGVWKSLVDRMKDKRDELARKAAKKAARSAVDSAGKMVDGVGKAIEEALFGDAEEPGPEAVEAPADPFAKLKAAEAAQKERDRVEKQLAKESAAANKKLDREVDAELAALKKRLGK